MDFLSEKKREKRNFFVSFTRIRINMPHPGETERNRIMVRELVHDPLLLARASRKATVEDRQIAEDLLDTLKAHADTCVGMAANMIGETVSIIAFDNGGSYMVMYNPEILKASDPYETEEGCLSLLGGPRKTKRFQKIKVKYQLPGGAVRLKTFSGWTAQIIQHEVDHCSGVLI